MSCHRFAFAALLCTSAISCSPSQDQGPTAARVGDAVLMETALEAQLPAGLDAKSAAAARAEAIDSWLMEELLYQEALERRLDEHPRVEEVIEQSRRSLLVANLLDNEFDGRDITVSDAEVQQYYDLNRDRFQLFHPQVRARHILLATRRDANAKLQMLNRGMPFEQLAREHSRDQDSKFEGGELGYFTAEEDPVLWEACESLQLDAYSKPIRTEYGYHIIRLLEQQEAGTYRELEQVRSGIVETLIRQAQSERLDALVNRLKEKRDWAIERPPEETR